MYSRWFKRNRILFLIFPLLLYYLGVFAMLLETDYEYFSYPLEVNVSELVEQVRKGSPPSVPPINEPNFSYVYNCRHKCQGSISPIRLVYLVKSARQNFDKREAIRRTWGFEKRFSDVIIRTVFLLGSIENDPQSDKLIVEEYKEHGDIVLGSMIDNYYNNTLKTLMGLHWAVHYCNRAKFFFFVDDDFYVSTKNVLRFLRSPLDYPNYLEIPIVALGPKNNRHLQQFIDYELPDDVQLFGGYCFPDSRPIRQMFSKWYVPLSEYKYNRWPPYLTAGSYVLSKEALQRLYYGSLFVKKFRFDDIYLAIVARKINLKPLPNKEFYFYKKDYGVNNYKYVIASHGYDDPNELIKVHGEQKSAGNA